MNLKILIIEDVKEMADLASIYLTKAGMSVDTVGSAEEAFEHLAKQMPNLIILDLNLPGMSGFDFLKKFRREYNSSLPVIIVSGRDADEDIIEGLGIGADEFVTKPYSPKVLVSRVEAIIRRQAKVTAAAEASYEFGPYTVLLNSCVLKKGPEKIPLSTKEYEDIITSSNISFIKDDIDPGPQRFFSSSKRRGLSQLKKIYKKLSKI